MSAERDDLLLARLGRPLRAAIGVVAATGLMAALLVEPAPSPADAARAGALVPGEAAAPGAPVDPAVPAPAGGPTDPAVPPTDPGVASTAPGLSAVPVPGVYRYRVESTRDGETTVDQEDREITQLDGDRTQGTVQIVARVGDERQVSVLEWSPAAALVRTTRIETGSTVGQDCTWAPPFPEFGALAAGSTWTVGSSCQSDVGGILTTFDVTGSGRVVDAVTVDGPGGGVPAWRIERTRTTVITAGSGPDQIRQQVDEQSTVFFDPARGVVVRSESVISTHGAQPGRVERVSVLQP